MTFPWVHFMLSMFGGVVVTLVLYYIAAIIYWFVRVKP